MAKQTVFSQTYLLRLSSPNLQLALTPLVVRLLTTGIQGRPLHGGAWMDAACVMERQDYRRGHENHADFHESF